MPTTIIDYGIGNLRSIEKALEHVGAEPVRTDDPERIAEAERLVLPGVGAFGACIGAVREREGLEAAICEAAEAGTPLLGVCVGMQLLFEIGEEHGTHDGLGLLEGRVAHFHQPDPAGGDAAASHSTLTVPHMGWNTTEATRPDSPLLRDLGEAPYFYFVHSYCARPTHGGDVLATTTYGARAFPAVVQRNNVFGVQFHPEKSQNAGLHLLRNFATL